MLEVTLEVTPEVTLEVTLEVTPEVKPMLVLVMLVLVMPVKLLHRHVHVLQEKWLWVRVVYVETKERLVPVRSIVWNQQRPATTHQLPVQTPARQEPMVLQVPKNVNVKGRHRL